MLCLFIFTRIVDILLFNQISGVNPSPVNMRHCQIHNVVIGACLNVTEKIILWKIVVRKFGFVCMFQPITLKQLYNLALIDTFRCLGFFRGDALDCGARGPGFDYRLWQGYF